MVKPPKILESILQFFIEYDERESLCGDFAETYALIINESGKTRALCWYLFQISILIPAFVFESLTWSLVMFSNYFIDSLDFDKYSYKLYYGATGIENKNIKEFLAPEDTEDILLVLGSQKENENFKEQVSPENIFLQKWYYLFILAIFFIILWFVIKTFLEKKHKDQEDKKNKFISKL